MLARLEVAQLVLVSLSLLLWCSAAQTAPTPTIAVSKYVGDVDAVEDVCSSTTGRHREAKLALRVKPFEREIIYDFDETAPKLEIDCLQLVDLGVNRDTLCEAESFIFLCRTEADKKEEVWECEELKGYTDTARRKTTHGSVNGPNLKWRMEYSPGKKFDFCFPRDVRLTFLSTTSFAIKGSAVLVAIFILILVGLIVVVLAFGGYQFKKTLTKIWRSSKLGTAYAQKVAAKNDEQGVLGLPFVQQIPDDVPMLLHEGKAMYVPPPEKDTGGDVDNSNVEILSFDDAPVDRGAFGYRRTAKGEFADIAPARAHETSFSRDTFRPNGSVVIPDANDSVYARGMMSPPKAHDTTLVDSTYLAATAQHSVIPPTVFSRMSPTVQRSTPDPSTHPHTNERSYTQHSILRSGGGGGGGGVDGSALLTPQGRSLMFSPPRGGRAISPGNL